MATAKGASGTQPWWPIFARFIDNNASRVGAVAARNSQLCADYPFSSRFPVTSPPLSAIVNERVIWSIAIETRFRSTAERSFFLFFHLDVLAISQPCVRVCVCTEG